MAWVYLVLNLSGFFGFLSHSLDTHTHFITQEKTREEREKDSLKAWRCSPTGYASVALSLVLLLLLPFFASFVLSIRASSDMNDQEFFIIVCLLSAAKDDKIKKS
jgi:hypothetical protein